MILALFPDDVSVAASLASGQSPRQTGIAGATWETKSGMQKSPALRCCSLASPSVRLGLCSSLTLVVSVDFDRRHHLSIHRWQRRLVLSRGHRR